MELILAGLSCPSHPKQYTSYCYENAAKSMDRLAYSFFGIFVEDDWRNVMEMVHLSISSTPVAAMR